MDTSTIESVMGRATNDIDAQVEAENRLNRLIYLDETSFEFSVKGLPRTEDTCDFALIPDASLEARNKLFLNTLVRDGIAYESLNATRGRMRPDCGLTEADARALAKRTADAVGHVIGEEHALVGSPKTIRAHVAYEDMLEAYRLALTCESAKLDAHDEMMATWLERDVDDDE